MIIEIEESELRHLIQMIQLAHPIARGSRTGRTGIAMHCVAFLGRYTKFRQIIKRLPIEEVIDESE